MSDEKEKDGLDTLRKSAKSPEDFEAFVAISTALGGSKLAIGISRIMDGLCPDCGSDEHQRCPPVPKEQP